VDLIEWLTRSMFRCSSDIYVWQKGLIGRELPTAVRPVVYYESFSHLLLSCPRPARPSIHPFPSLQHRRRRIAFLSLPFLHIVCKVTPLEVDQRQ
jgi:hypothetical protein